MSKKAGIILCAALGAALSAALGLAFFMPDVWMPRHTIADAEQHIRPYDETLSNFLMLMDLYEEGISQPRQLEDLCRQGYAPGCLARGLTALTPKGADGYDPELNRKEAEDFFRKGCGKEELPICSLIAETRKDDAFRDPENEERVITGILMTSCELGAFKACGEAAMRLFEAGDFQMARRYGARGCAMKDRRGDPFGDPRSCSYRRLALEKLASAAAVPEAAAASEAAPENTGRNKP